MEVSGGCKYYYKLNNKHIKRSYRAFKDEIIWVGIVMHIVGVRLERDTRLSSQLVLHNGAKQNFK